MSGKCPPKGLKPLPVPEAQPPRVTAIPHPTTELQPTTAPQPAPPVAVLLALHIPFDRYSGMVVLDTSNKANNGVLNNVRVAALPQACGLAGIFSKGNISLNGRTFFPKPSVAVSIAVWVKLFSTVGRQSLFDTIGEVSPEHQGNYHFEIVDGHVRWFHRDLQGNVVFNVTTNQAVIPEHRWTHLVGTYDKQEGTCRHSV